MNTEETQAEVIGKLMEYVESTEVFVQEQAPLVVQEILRVPWVEFMAHMPLYSVFVLLFLFIRVFRGRIFAFDDTLDSSEKGLAIGGYYVALGVWGLLGCVAVLPIFTSDIRQVISATMTPRLFVMEYLSNLL